MGIKLPNRKRPTVTTVLTVLVFAFLFTAPLYLSMFRISMLAKYTCYAIVALGLDMIWGYTGILSLGHGVFFGLGAYCMAMYLKLEAAGGALPDFMVWSGLSELPALWTIFQYPAVALIMVVLVPVALAVIIGYLTFLNRIRGVYFSILSQALAMVTMTLLIGQQAYTGGTNGLTSFTTLFGLDLGSNYVKFAMFYVTATVLLLLFLLCRFLTGRRVGKVLVAIRDGESRVRFSGYDTARYKLFVYALSAGIAGIAGALYVIQVGIITPTEVGVSASIGMIIWVAIGGKGTLIGPILGALVTSYLETAVSERFPDAWSYFIGIAFVVVILWLPGGLVSLKDIPAKLRARRTRGAEEASAPAAPTN